MKTRQQAIPCSIIRGGTSRGVYFLARDLPTDTHDRDRLLRGIMGGPDGLQVDGLGGGHPLTSKIALVSRSARDDADIDYLFLQLTPTTGQISDGQNCGNILAGVGPFAIDHGLVAAQDDSTRMRVHMVNSGNLCELTILTPDGVIEYRGDESIDGVPGTAAPIVCDFLDIAGSATGALLPTGNVIDSVGGVEMTCVDNGMPVVLLRASDLGRTGQETPDELDADTNLKRLLEDIRIEIGAKMGLGDVAEKTVPKMCLLSPAANGGHIATRTFIPHHCHRAIGVLGAVSVATGCLLKGSVGTGIAGVPEGAEKTMLVEHPSGALRVRLVVDPTAPPESMVRRAGVIRTARTLMRGEAFAPAML